MRHTITKRQFAEIIDRRWDNREAAADAISRALGRTYTANRILDFRNGHRPIPTAIAIYLTALDDMDALKARIS